MATLVRSTYVYASGTLTLPNSETAGAGNLIFVGVGKFSTGATGPTKPTPPAGTWEELGYINSASTYGHAIVWAKVADGTETSFSPGELNGTYRIVYGEWSDPNGWPAVGSIRDLLASVETASTSTGAPTLTSGATQTATDGAAAMSLLVPLGSWSSTPVITWADSFSKIHGDSRFHGSTTVRTINGKETLEPAPTWDLANDVVALLVSAKVQLTKPVAVVDPAGDRSVMEGATVSRDLSGSYDPDGTIAAYSTEQTGLTATITETWTGADGAAWPAAWADETTTAGAAADILTNRGRLVTGTVGAYGDSIVRRHTAATPNAADIRVTWTAATADEASLRTVFRRVDASNFYRVTLRPAANDGLLEKVVAGTATELGTFTTPTLTAATRLRVQAVGSSLRVRVWADGATEPETWDVETADDSHTSGAVSVGLLGGNAAASRTAYVDDFTVTDALAVDWGATLTTATPGYTVPAGLDGQVLNVRSRVQDNSGLWSDWVAWTETIQGLGFSAVPTKLRGTVTVPGGAGAATTARVTVRVPDALAGEQYRARAALVAPGTTTEWVVGGLAAKAVFNVERGGKPVAGSPFTADARERATIVDRFAAPNEAETVRWRVTTTASGSPVAGPWTETTVTVPANAYRLHHPTDGSFDIELVVGIGDAHGESSQERVGLFYAPGADVAYVRAEDTPKAPVHRFTLRLHTQDQFDRLKALRAEQVTMQLRSPSGETWWVRFGAELDAALALINPAALHAGTAFRDVPITLITTGPPSELG